MKTLMTVLVLGLVSLWASIPGIAQPAVSDSYSGAAVVEESTIAKPSKGLASNGGFVGGIVVAHVIPILGKPLNPGNGWLEHIVFEQDWMTDLKDWVPVIDGPVSWKNLVYAESVGVATSQWSVVQLLVHLRSIDGSDSINIGMFSMSSVETPTGILSHVYDVVNQSYSPAAKGFKADGTVITGGANDQMVAEIVLVVQMRLFNGGGTPAGLKEVRNWVLRQGFFKIAYAVMMEGREVRGGEAAITVQKPYLTITPDSVTLQGDESGILYDIQYTDRVDGQWRNLTTAYSGDRIPIVPTGTAKFFRAISRE